MLTLLNDVLLVMPSVDRLQMLLDVALKGALILLLTGALNLSLRRVGVTSLIAPNMG